MTEYLESWRKALEDRGTRVSMSKTQWMESRFEEVDSVDRQTVKISGEESKKVNNFKYMGTVEEENGGVDMPEVRPAYTLFTLSKLAFQASFSCIECHTEGDGTMTLLHRNVK